MSVFLQHTDNETNLYATRWSHNQQHSRNICLGTLPTIFLNVNLEICRLGRVLILFPRLRLPSLSCVLFHVTERTCVAPGTRVISCGHRPDTPFLSCLFRRSAKIIVLPRRHFPPRRAASICSAPRRLFEGG